MKKHRGVFEKVPASGSWWIRYIDADGKFRREKVGSKSAAINLYRLRKTEALKGVKLPAKLRQPMVSFGELADVAIKYVQSKYTRPADDAARLVLLKARFPGRADMITPGQIENTLDCLTVEKGWSASTRNHHHNLISVSYRLGILHSEVKENPARGVQRKPENNSRVRYLTSDEEKKLREAIRSKPEWAEHEPEFDLALSTGLRRNSMYLDLTWENVDLAARTLKIPRTKNGDPITLPLNADAMRALHIFRSRGDGTGRVVRNAMGKTLTVTAHWFPPAVRAAKIAPFRWHDCRHCFASKLRQAGVPLGNIAELLGQKGLAMTRRYAHLSISNLHEAVARIEQPTDTTVAPEPIFERDAISYVN
jgi:integrase